MKQYQVEVLGKYSHGQYGKPYFTSWVLGHSSKDGAKDFAFEILAGKTWAEFKQEVEISNPIEMSTLDWWQNGCWASESADENDIIGFENVKRHFSFRATLMKKGVDYE